MRNAPHGIKPVRTLLLRNHAVRIIILTLISIALFAAALYGVMLPLFAEHLTARKKELVREVVHSACSLLATYNEQVEAGEISLPEAQQRAIGRLRQMRYGQGMKNYYWINDQRPVMIMHPYRPELEGRDLSADTDAAGNRIFVQAVRTVQAHGAGFIAYRWQWYDNRHNVTPKISYVKGFDPWGWVVGSGIYVADVQAQIGAILSTINAVALAIVGILLVLCGAIVTLSVMAERQRKKTRLSLQQSEEKFRCIFDQSYQYMGMLAPDGTVLACNQAALALVDVTEQEVLGKPFWCAPWWTHTAEEQNLLQEALAKAAQGQFIRFETTHKSCDGSVVDVDFSLNPVKDESGRVILIIPEGRNITAIKQAEHRLRSAYTLLKAREQELEAANEQMRAQELQLLENNDALRETNRKLRESEQYLSLVLDIGRSTIWEIDLKTDRVSIKRLPHTMPYTAEDFPEMLADFKPMYTPASWKRSIQAIDACRQGQTDTYETELSLFNPDGSNRWHYSLGKVIAHDDAGTPLTLLGTSIDITQIKQAEENLLRLAAVVEQAVEYIVITDMQGRIEYINPSYCAATGYCREEVIGQKPSLFKSGQHDDAFYHELWQTISRGETWQGQFANRKKDGSIFQEDATITPIRSPEGDIINYVAVKRDITLENKMKEQLRQAQKMESVGTLASGIAHDFNKILAAVIGYTELSIEDTKSLPATHGFLQQVLTAANRAKDLVGQILTFSRATAVNKTPTTTIPIVKEVCKFIRSSLPATIEIKQRIIAQHDRILADPTQFHQILMNLCTNAGHAMRQTGGVLEVGLDETILDAEDLKVHPELQMGPHLKLTVSDTGDGITAENLERIFEPYFTTKEQGEGTGLGLAVVHGIVREYRGDIRVYSEVGTGTVFQLLFPLIAAEADTKRPETPAPLPTGTETILFVDDEPSIVTACTRMLERLGYAVTGATSAEESLTVFSKEPTRFDLVITDKTMPRMTGFDLAQQIKTIHPDIPIMLCTGFNDKADVARTETTGIAACIAKPLGKRQLAEAVRKVLDQE